MPRQGRKPWWNLLRNLGWIPFIRKFFLRCNIALVSCWKTPTNLHLQVFSTSQPGEPLRMTVGLALSFLHWWPASFPWIQASLPFLIHFRCEHFVGPGSLSEPGAHWFSWACWPISFTSCLWIPKLGLQMLAVVPGFYVCHEELNSSLMLMWHVLYWPCHLPTSLN